MPTGSYVANPTSPIPSHKSINLPNVTTAWRWDISYVVQCVKPHCLLYLSDNYIILFTYKAQCNHVHIILINGNTMFEQYNRACMIPVFIGGSSGTTLGFTVDKSRDYYHNANQISWGRISISYEPWSPPLSRHIPCLFQTFPPSASLNFVNMFCCFFSLRHRFIFFKSLSHWVLVLDETRTHNLLIFAQTPEPSCLGVRQEDSCLPKLWSRRSSG